MDDVLGDDVLGDEVAQQKEETDHHQCAGDEREGDVRLVHLEGNKT